MGATRARVLRGIVNGNEARIARAEIEGHDYYCSACTIQRRRKRSATISLRKAIMTAEITQTLL